jgi:MYXO-CTERM domain-containing protein
MTSMWGVWQTAGSVADKTEPPFSFHWASSTPKKPLHTSSTMKIRHPLAASLLALAGAAFIQPNASAQVPVSYSPDDLILAFRTTGGSTPAASSYLVDLGPASFFTGSAAGSQVSLNLALSLGDIQADLVALFGANWFSRSDLFWSISGTTGSSAADGDPSRTLYASREEDILGVQSIPWTRANSSGQAAPANKLASVGNGFAADGGNPNLSTANSDVAIIQANGATNSFASFQADGSSFSYFSPTIEGDFGDGFAGTALDLYRLAPGSGATVGAAGDFVGSFSIDGGAQLTFNAAVVPEPGSAVVVAAGAGLLGLIRRRRTA